jgi:hypothetical protein
MSETIMRTTDQPELFRRLVEDLTGFEQTDAGLLREAERILRSAPQSVGSVDALVAAYRQTNDLPSLFTEAAFANTLQQMLFLFYLGALLVDGRWRRCGWTQHETALVWACYGVRPPMTRGSSGFGDWAHPPSEATKGLRR